MKSSDVIAYDTADRKLYQSIVYITAMLSRFGEVAGQHLPKRAKWLLRPFYNITRDVELTISYYLYSMAPDEVIDTGFGFKLSVDKSDYVQKRYLSKNDPNEESSIEFFKQQIESLDGDFIDIGANIGFYSLLYYYRGSGSVYAFEPLLPNVTKLIENILINGADGVMVYPFGLSDQTYVSQLDYNPVNKGAASEVSDNKGPNILSRSEKCSFKKLDEIQGLSDNISVIKIDVEGHELDVLKGARKIIKRHKPELLIEVHPEQLEKKDQTIAELLAEIFAFGYESIYLIQDGEVLDQQEATSAVNSIKNNYAIWCKLEQQFPGDLDN
jgi:FkbM family methyltransferase